MRCRAWIVVLLGVAGPLVAAEPPVNAGVPAIAADEAPPQDDAAAYEPVQQIELYRAALRALAENRPDEASELLKRFLEKEPQHAGALLDLAISQCELGNGAEAERLFSDIEARFDPPQGIVDVITTHRATGCKEPARRPASWVANMARGHDNNVNQGTSFPTFTIGNDEGQTEYELSPEFLPREDNYSQLGLSYLQPLNRRGTLAIVQLSARRNDHEHQQDVASALAAVEHVWTPGKWRVRGTAALGAVVLDNAMYQRQQQIQARVTPPALLPQPFDLSLTATASHLRYPTRPNYGGTTYELGSMLSYSSGVNLAQFTVTRLTDHGNEGRPGGDRSGWFSSLQWYTRLSAGLNGEAGVTYVDWRSREFYSPGLIEQVRLQRTTTARLALQWYVRPNYSLVGEWRGTQNRENIKLFQYNSRSLQLSLRWDNF